MKKCRRLHVTPAALAVLPSVDLGKWHFIAPPDACAKAPGPQMAPYSRVNDSISYIETPNSAQFALSKETSPWNVFSLATIPPFGSGENLDTSPLSFSFPHASIRLHTVAQVKNY